MEIEIRENQLLVFIEKSLYSDDIVHKCFYWFGGTFDVDISDYSLELYLVKLIPHSAMSEWQKTINKIKRDLIDFKLRDIVTKETQTVRELIVAKAFVYQGLGNDNPTSSITDLVGFDPDIVSK